MKKLIIAVVQNEDADNVVDALLEDEFRATRLASTGGFLRRGNTTLMIGSDEDQVDRVLGLIRKHARSEAAPADTGAATQPAAATVFVLDLEEYQRL
ncbi:MAG: cyclic-di-AMP receptor [Chloroflexota bacterium]|nr:cyclic-di-AMP receptor [Chloroflexota bacterium]